MSASSRCGTLFEVAAKTKRIGEIEAKIAQAAGMSGGQRSTIDLEVPGHDRLALATIGVEALRRDAGGGIVKGGDCRSCRFRAAVVHDGNGQPELAQPGEDVRQGMVMVVAGNDGAEAHAHGATVTRPVAQRASPR